ncbi:MAG: polyamine aminopropyltransferase, partial [Planctomycetota bacterium]
MPAYRELDFQETPYGELVLRTRPSPGADGETVWEVKLNDEFLMSSLVHRSESELAERGLEGLGDELEVVVGGLGLGYTARAALDVPGVRTVAVVELFEPVIRWHREGLVPEGEALTADPRCRFVQGDFFAMAAADGFDPDAPGRTFDAVLLDIDHSPRALLQSGHAPFYEADG